MIILTNASDEGGMMADPTRDPNLDDGRTPSWAKAFWIGIVVLVVLFVILHLLGGGMGRPLTPADRRP